MLADISIEVVLKTLFLSFTNAKFQFSARKFIWKFYTSAETLLIAKQVELINKYKFANTIFNKNSKTFIIHIFDFKATQLTLLIYLS